MGIAIDTVLGSASAANTGFTAVTVATGDTTTVRSISPTATATLEQVMMAGAVGCAGQIKSPLLHDDVRGLQFEPGENPAVFDLPAVIGQPLQSQDTLAVAVEGASGTAAEVAIAYTIYYSDLSGASANLKMWGDISGFIEQVKPLEVAAAASATVGQWNDVAITTTEDLLKANRWYAILGYLVSAGCCCVAIKGTDTSNLRIGGPGTVRAEVTSNYFVNLSAKHGTPHIPVFNSANKDTTFVSTADYAASTANNVQLVCALLSPAYTG